MGLLNSFYSGVKNGQAELANYHNNFDKFLGMGFAPAKKTKDDEQEIGVYSGGNVAWVNIAINRKMWDLSNIDYFFVNRDGEKVDWDDVPEELRKAFDNGFAGFSLNDLIAMAGGHEDLSGNALWLKNSDANAYSKLTGRIDQIMPITPGRFKIKLNNKGNAVENYTIIWDDRTQTVVEPEQVIHFKRNSIVSPFVGIGLISQGRAAVDFVSVANDYQVTFLEKDGTPDLVYIDKTPLHPEMAKSKQQQLSESYRMRKYANGLMYANGDVDIKAFNISSRDMQYVENMGMSERQIISLLESTGSVLGLPDANNKASATQLTNNYFGIVNSKAWHLLDAINKQFIYTVKGNENKELTLSCTPYAVGDIEQLTKAVSSGFLSPANASKELGYEYDSEDEASNALYISKGVGTLQSNFETQPVDFSGMLSGDIENIKKKILIRDYLS
jgi:HK97 family phage portal protein